MKRFFSKIGVALSKVTWVIRRRINQFGNFIKAITVLTFNKITRKTHRLAKRHVKRAYFKDFVGVKNYNIDIRFDLNLEKIRDEVLEEYQQLKEIKINSKDEAVKAEQQRLKHIDNLRYQAAKHLEDNILSLEFKRDKEITALQNKHNFFTEEIEEVIDRYKAEIQTLKVEYDNYAQSVLLSNPPTETEENEFVRKLHVSKMRSSLPETRKRLETKDRARNISKNLLQAIIYLTPALIFLLVFTFYPIVNAFRLVVYENYDDVSGVYSGITLFGNFAKVLKDANFIVPGRYVKSSAMLNTLLIVGVTVPISIIISLLISVLLNSIKALTNLFQTIFFLPYVTNSLAVGLVFAYMFQTNGLFNKFLAFFNVDGGSWVQHGAPYWKAMFVLLLFSIWNGLAFKIMVFLSSIQGIDKQYYQAASIDATPRFKQFRRITAPLISPTILYIVITSVIGSFKTYSSVIAIFGNRGRPPGADYHLKTIVFYIYDYFNVTGKMPEAAAASIVLFGIILLMTLIQMQVSKKRVHY